MSFAVVFTALDTLSSEGSAMLLHAIAWFFDAIASVLDAIALFVNAGVCLMLLHAIAWFINPD